MRLNQINGLIPKGILLSLVLVPNQNANKRHLMLYALLACAE